jgi:cystathionine beta-lyase/cystathionine gamma-synthase
MMKKKEINSARVPVFRDSGFELYDADTTAGAFKKETNNEREPELYIYSRYRNPTVVAAEEELMKLEKCEWVLLTQSGMSAVDTALSVFQRGKDTRPWLFFTEIYGGTISFIESVLKKRRGLDIHSFNPVKEAYDLIEFEEVIKKLRPELVYLETISNPLLIVADVAGVVRIAGKYGVKVLVDNTFATPYLFKPLDFGANIVIHSATKYFSGHGNLTAGVICGNDKEIMRAAIEYRKFVGHMLSPDDAYRLTTQIKSFELRFVRQCENAIRLASWLNEVPVIEKVWFPGLKDHATQDEAVKLFGKKYFGAMITFGFAGKNGDEKKKRRDNFIRNVSEKIKLIPTLGDPYTILIPVEAVWGAKYPEPGMIRLSIGFENFDELERTISKALKIF